MRSFVVVVLASALVAIACSACGITGGMTASVIGHATSAPPVRTAPGGDVPETLAAATAAAQADIDRFTAGDFAGVWKHMENSVREGITREDFVTFYEACKKAGPPISVRGMRLQSDDEAIVLMKSRGVERSRIMVYEDGVWNMQATDDFAAHLGEPVQDIIAKEAAAGLCTR